MGVNMENKLPAWIEKLSALVRPGSLAAMVGLLVLGGFLFAAIELFLDGAGARAADVFVGFFRAMDDNYYTTIQVMFTSYVVGRSGQAIARDYANAKVAEATARSANGPD